MILLPWPDSRLSPNARTHYRVKAKIAAEHKQIGYFAAKPDSFSRILPEGRIPIRVIFHAPDRRRRDIDNIFSSCKNFCDGIALAYGIDDSRFRPITLDFAAETFPKGKIEIFFE
jgi:Holliday junction resolvase RusA-like endonuclease